MRLNSYSIRSLAVATVFAVSAFTAQAATVNLKADLKGGSEVPAKDVAGTGTVTASLDTDTNELKYHVVYSGLTGPVAAAHFHGPAAEGANAKPQVPVKAPFDSPIEGTAKLTAEQAKDLADGKWYFNLHTAANPGGEIRGQVTKAN
ncbi:MAG: domain containing protein [Acidobacteriaceae bacterium]|nr:domain containing protein [Acidobacteriaceae bacterium]